jgi:hypothetical protein
MRAFVGAAILAINCIVFSPLFFAVFWHLWHGQKVICDGIQISVPARWWARIDDEKIRLYKHSLTVFGGDTALSSLSRNRGVATSQTEDEALSVVENIYLKMRDGNDFNPVGSITFGAGQQKSPASKRIRSRTLHGSLLTVFCFPGLGTVTLPAKSQS